MNMLRTQNGLGRLCSPSKMHFADSDDSDDNMDAATVVHVDADAPLGPSLRERTMAKEAESRRRRSCIRSRTCSTDPLSWA
jgi:hypothetical protein